MNEEKRENLVDGIVKRAGLIGTYDGETGYILEKLQKVFEDGYRPARKDESYLQYIKPGLKTGDIMNCMGHACFNLRNQQFIDYDIKCDGKFYLGRFCQYSLDKNSFFERFDYDKTANGMLDFIGYVGLKVEKCEPNAIIKDFRSWKIAMYLGYSSYHFLLEDTPQLWSSKNGSCCAVELFRGETPPDRIRNVKLYGTYKITNEKADENNPYVKDRQF